MDIRIKKSGLKFIHSKVPSSGYIGLKYDDIENLQNGISNSVSLSCDSIPDKKKNTPYKREKQ